MSAVAIINGSGLIQDDKDSLKMFCSTNGILKSMIEEEPQISNNLLLIYLNQQKSKTASKYLLILKHSVCLFCFH